jgi:hypothetical protein
VIRKEEIAKGHDTSVIIDILSCWATMIKNKNNNKEKWQREQDSEAGYGWGHTRV